MKNLKSIGLITALLFSAIMFLGTKPAAAESYKWKMQSFINANHYLYKQFAQPFTELVKKRTNGEFEITLFAANAIIPSRDITKAIASGALDASHNSTAYDNGIIPETYILTNLPMSFSTASEAEDFWYHYQDGAAWKMVVQEYAKKRVYIEAVINVDDPQAFMTMFPVNNLSDLKGKKIRATGKWSEVIKKLGATQVNMSLGEVYTGLQTNVIDGVEMAITGLEDFKWKEIIRYVVLPPLQSGASTTFQVNPKSYNALPEKYKKILNEAIKDTIRDNLQPYCEDYYKKTRKNAEALGVQFVTLSDQDIKSYVAANEVLWSYAEGLGKNNAKLIAMLKDYLDSKGIAYPGSK